MSNDLMVFPGAGATQVPAHVAQFFEANETNIVERDRVPTLSFKGKVWTIALRDGTKNQLTRRNADGDTEMVQTLRVVVLDYAKQRGRAYYQSYDPEMPGPPLCWSEDGVRPDASVTEPQAPTCAGCPMSVKGSKVTEAGKSVTACSQHRHVVVMPAVPDMTFEPLRLKLAITSLFDKQSPELEKEGWRAFENYLDFLRGNGVKHTATLVTKMRFDPNVAYPKIIFSPERWLEPAEVEAVKARLEDGSIEALLRGTTTEATESPAPAAALPPAMAQPAPAAPVPPPAPAKPAAVAPATKPGPKPASKPAPVQMDLGMDEQPAPAGAVPPPPAPTIKPAPTGTVTTDVPEDVKALLDEWGDD